MIAVDTNVLVRVIVADDERQTAVARALVERALEEGASIFVSDTVLCETAWVLDSCYSAPRFTIADALAGLLAAEQLAVPGREDALRAVDAYRNGKADFADYLIRERGRAHGAAAVATFDAQALTEDGFVPPDPTAWPDDLTLHERPPRYGRKSRARL
jgi:predicted nucleic-acid-binding protein